MYLVRLARRWLGLRMCSHKTTYTTVASQPASLECSDCRIIMSSFQSKQLQWQPSRIQNLLFWRQLIKSVTKKIINILQNRISAQNFLSLLHTLRVYYCMRGRWWWLSWWMAPSYKTSSCILLLLLLSTAHRRSFRSLQQLLLGRLLLLLPVKLLWPL